MKFVRDLGIGQCVMPPLLRPNLNFLREIGFGGSDGQVIESAFKQDPVLVSASYSASSMWTANAAMVSPAVDCDNGRLNLTPANLVSNLHRSIEPYATMNVLKAIFNDEQHFAVHDPVRSTMALADEGAANHTRLAQSHESPGIEVFVYGLSLIHI